MAQVSQPLYQSGVLALKQAHYAEAIAALETFCKETANRQSKQFFQAQMLLVQAYHKEHQDLHAIALCEQLAKSDIPQVKQWAENALNQLMVANESPDQARTMAQTQPARVERVDEDCSNAVDQSDATHQPAAQGSPYYSLGPTKSRVRVGSKPSKATATGQKDYSNQILTALAHGSISMLASILLYALFADSLLANFLGLLRFAVPLIILFTTNNAVVKANAREATNYVITSLILLFVIIFAAIFLAVAFVVVWPIAIVLGIALGVYLLVLSIYPIVATIQCAIDANRVFRYPNWLILHIL
jgi:uncharacterized Tic20 family protein